MNQVRKVTYAELNESSLAGAWPEQVATGHSVAILGARTARTPPTQVAWIADRLRQKLSSMHLTVSAELIGHWHVAQPDGGSVHHRDLSFMVSGITLEQVLRIQARFQQEVVIYAGPETSGAVTLRLLDGSSRIVGPFHAASLAKAYGAHRGELSTFKGFEKLPDHIAARMVGVLTPLVITDEDLDLPPRIHVERLALVRYAERFRSNEVNFDGPNVTVSFSQELFNVAGQSQGVARITFSGEEAFGRRVALDTTPVIMLGEGSAPPSERTFLNDLARDLAATLLEICTCGRFRESCDCCTACDGAGDVCGGDGSAPCLACQGIGFLTKSDGQRQRHA